MERSLREEIILDYARRRPGFGFEVARATDAASHVRSVHRRNPLCGDEVELRLEVAADATITRLRWEGRGCTVSQASAAMLAARAEGMTTAGLRMLSREVHALIVDTTAAADGDGDGDDVLALAGVGRFPLRARCAGLAWDAVDEAIGLEAALLTGPDRVPR